MRSIHRNLSDTAKRSNKNLHVFIQLRPVVCASKIRRTKKEYTHLFLLPHSGHSPTKQTNQSLRGKLCYWNGSESTVLKDTSENRAFLGMSWKIPAKNLPLAKEVSLNTWFHSTRMVSRTVLHISEKSEGGGRGRPAILARLIISFAYLENKYLFKPSFLYFPMWLCGVGRGLAGEGFGGLEGIGNDNKLLHLGATWQLYGLPETEELGRRIETADVE